MIQKEKIYRAREGAPITDSQAQEYGKRIETLMKKNKGHINPSEIVEDAKNKTSPYHNFFEWDNVKGAKLYRLQQARQLVESIVIEVKINGIEKPQRALVSVTIKEINQKAYVPLEIGITTKSYRQELLQKLKATLKNGGELLDLIISYDS